MTEKIEETEADSEETMEFTEDQIKILVTKGLLFEQLLQSEKFTTFFGINYDLGKDPTTMELYLVEVPHEVVVERTQTVLQAMQAAQAKEASVVLPTANEVVKFNSK